jgi:hypothetical protein
VTVYHELRDRLLDVTRREARAVAPAVEKWRVTSIDPLTIAEVGGDGELEAGDPDFEVERWVRQYDTDTGLEVGDVLYVHRESDRWVAFGIAEAGEDG